MSNTQLKEELPNFYLELGQLTKAHTQFLSQSFNNLPTSPYKDGEYRLRRFSHFNFKDNVLTQLPHKSFSQSNEFNKFQGDVVRDYEEIESKVIESSAFLEIFQHFKSMANVADSADIEVHQMRIFAKPTKQRPITPEGVHQDGYKHIAICTVQRKHIKEGGDLCIHNSKNGKPFIKGSFDAGEFIVMNDQRFWHSATDMVAEEQHKATMDVFVLTA